MDASFTIPWVFRDEANALSDEAWRVLFNKVSTGHVPALWFYEMVNVTVRGSREGPQVSREDLSDFFGVLRLMPLKVHHQTSTTTLEVVPRLMRQHDLTSYDSAYLALALERGLPLATRDKALKKAARKEGVELL